MPPNPFPMGRQPFGRPPWGAARVSNMRATRHPDCSGSSLRRQALQVPQAVVAGSHPSDPASPGLCRRHDAPPAGGGRTRSIVRSSRQRRHASGRSVCSRRARWPGSSPRPPRCRGEPGLQVLDLLVEQFDVHREFADLGLAAAVLLISRIGLARHEADLAPGEEGVPPIRQTRCPHAEFARDCVEALTSQEPQ